MNTFLIQWTSGSRSRDRSSDKKANRLPDGQTLGQFPNWWPIPMQCAQWERTKMKMNLKNSAFSNLKLLRRFLPPFLLSIDH